MPRRLLSPFLTRAINQQLGDHYRRQFARHAGQHIALRLPPFAIVWRITDAGDFVLTSSLLDADVRIERQGGGIQVQGDAGLLNILSDFWRETDWQVALTEPFGATLAPRMLFAIERLDEMRENALKGHTVNAEEFAVFRDNTAQFHEQVTRVFQRVADIK